MTIILRGLSISTITATAKVHVNPIPLADLFAAAPIHADAHRAYADPVLVFAQWDRQHRGSFYNPRSARLHAARFDHQLTLVAKVPSIVPDVDAPYWVNFKIFQNGVVHMVGMKRLEDCARMAAFLDEILRQSGCVSLANATATDVRVHMINSDFKVNYWIRRKSLCELLVTERGNRASFEPTIYPGVKLFYYPCGPNGNCTCSHDAPVPAGSPGALGPLARGGRPAPCKRVTVIVFQRGSVIVTGAHRMDDVEAAYRYIVNVLTDARGAIEMPPTPQGRKR